MTFTPEPRPENKVRNLLIGTAAVWAILIVLIVVKVLIGAIS